jgi:hypothetical protein
MEQEKVNINSSVTNLGTFNFILGSSQNTRINKPEKSRLTETSGRRIKVFFINHIKKWIQDIDPI